MMQIGNNENPFLGLYDEGDGRDAPIGSFSILDNFIVNKKRKAISARGGHTADIAHPSTLYVHSNGQIDSNATGGTASGLAYVKRLYARKHLVSNPSEKLIHFEVALYSFTTDIPTTGYTMRILMYPYWDGSAFQNYWKDITPYVFDRIVFSNSVTGSSNNYSIDIGGDSSWLYSYRYDLIGAYVYIEDTSFASPQVHNAEGDKITGIISYYGTTFNCSLENDPLWNMGMTDVLRVHKNLATGRIPYLEFISSSSAGFDSYSFDSFKINEDFCLSVNSGSETKLSYTLKIGYCKQKSFVGTDRNIWFKNELFYDTAGVPGSFDRLFSKFLVYGFPLCETLYANNNLAAGNMILYNGLTSVSATASYNVTVSLYNKVKGQLNFTDAIVPNTCPNNYMVRFTNRNVEVSINDFCCVEMDVHGKTTSHLDFHTHLEICPASIELSSETTKKDAPTGALVMLNDGVEPIGNEVGFLNALPAYQPRSLSHICALHNGYRFGLQSMNYHVFEVPSHIYDVLYTQTFIPFNYNRTINGFIFTMTNMEDLYGLNFNFNTSKAVVDDDMQTGFDYRIVTASGSVTDIIKGAGFTKEFRIDKTIYETASLGGNHLTITGNPDYNYNGATALKSVLASDQTVSTLGRNRSKIKKDYSFGAKTNVLLKSMLFSADARFQEFQIGALSDAKEEKYFVWRSDFGEFSPNYHIFDSDTLRISNTDIGQIKALSVISYPASLDAAVAKDRNDLLILAENGYKYCEVIIDNNIRLDEKTYYGDACVSKNSVVNENGIVYCAGNEGVYMFQGAQKIDLTKMSGSRVNKTWRALSKTQKQESIGVYYKSRNWYVLYYKEPLFMRAIVFDIGDLITNTLSDEKEITASTWYIVTNFGIGMIGAQYINGKSYIYFQNGSTYYYNESVYLDGTFAFVAQARLNNVPTSMYTKLDYIRVDYSGDSDGFIQASILIDDVVAVIHDIDEGQNVYKNLRVPRKVNDRGKRFTIDLLFPISAGGLNEIYGIDFKFSDVPQKKLARLDV